MSFDCISNPDLKTVCIGDNATTTYWLKDETTAYSTTCGNVGVGASAMAASFQVYPNPTSQYLYISNAQGFDSYTIIHSTGQRVMQAAATQQLDISSLPDGFYLLEAIDKQGYRLVTKWQKR